MRASLESLCVGLARQAGVEYTLERWGLVLAHIFVAGPRATPGGNESLPDPPADAHPPDPQVADPVLGPDGDLRVVEDAVVDGHQRAAVFAAAPTHAEADLVFAEEAALD